MSVTPIPDGTPNWGPILNSQLNDLQSQVTINLDTLTTNEWTPGDQGLISWTNDPSMVAATAALGTSGVLKLARFLVKKAAGATSITIGRSVAQTAGVSGQNFAGIYNASGVLIAQTADQTATWAGAAGITIMSLTGITALSPGQYWVALLNNGTGPSIIQGGTATGFMGNVGTSPTTRRFATQGTGYTTLPASFDPTTIVSANNPWNILIA